MLGNLRDRREPRPVLPARRGRATILTAVASVTRRSARWLHVSGTERIRARAHYTAAHAGSGVSPGSWGYIPNGSDSCDSA